MEIPSSQENWQVDRLPVNILFEFSFLKPYTSLLSSLELVWIGAVCGLAALVMICVILLLVTKKKHTYRMRSGTDTSMLSHLTAAAAKSEEEQGTLFSSSGGSTNSRWGGVEADSLGLARWPSP